MAELTPHPFPIYNPPFFLIFTQHNPLFSSWPKHTSPSSPYFLLLLHLFFLLLLEGEQYSKFGVVKA
ncbi:uncharacterized protein DS421_12g370120 [Arachis hypogaea]|nr:uncharacterized protein DS421_12g370120 [Arachis hypogaea]